MGDCVESLAEVEPRSLFSETGLVLLIVHFSVLQLFSQ